MKLADYLFFSGMTPRDAQGLLGIKSRSTIHRYLTGERRPGKTMMRRIHQLTGGKVTLDDFDGWAPDCATTIRNKEGKLSVVLPWSTRDWRLEAAHKAGLDAPEEDDTLSEQAKRALRVLAGRAHHLGLDKFQLDGRLSDLRRVVREANRMIVAHGLDPIEYPLAHPKWRHERTERHRWGLTGFFRRRRS